MKRHLLVIVLALPAAVLAGCPTTPVGPTGGPVGPTEGPTQVSAETREGFTEVVERFMRIRQGGQAWTEAQCNEVADLFEEVSDDSSSGVAEAVYARGVAYQQCNLHDRAREAFQKALEIKQDYPPALVQLGLYALLNNNQSEAENYFNRAYRADIAAYQAYINLAVLAFEGGRFHPPQQCEGCADTLIGSALAIQADAVVALENLARFYFQYSQLSEENRRFRRFALLVCQYALTKNSQYAPIYNLRALIYLAEDNIRAAISDLQKAITLDPEFYEAHMNYASLNLGFRGYQQALASYEQALTIRPDSYDALIGAGVAIRGLASEAEASEDEYGGGGGQYTYDMAIRKYEAAKQLDGTRPEAWFNIALIQHRFSNLSRPEQYDLPIGTYREALNRCRGQQQRPESGIDYRELETAIQENLDQAIKDQETLRQMQLMEQRAAEEQRQAEEAMRQVEAQQRAQEAANPPPPAPAPEGGETPPPEGGATPPPEGGGEGGGP
jgi:tetratricopeptide (TPR) repeat protein